MVDMDNEITHLYDDWGFRPNKLQRVRLINHNILCRDSIDRHFMKTS